MNTPEWFPESASTPGEIQITLFAGIFYIQGYGADGLLPEILTVKKKDLESLGGNLTKVIFLKKVLLVDESR
jgi:hypothetical protein